MIRLVEVEALSDHRLRVRFSDGSSGVASMLPLIRTFEPFEPLLDEKIFAEACVEGHAVAWPSARLDLAVEKLYAITHVLPEPMTHEACVANEREMKLRKLGQHLAHYVNRVLGVLGIKHDAKHR